MQRRWGLLLTGLRGHFGKVEILVNNAGINTKSDRVPIHQYNLRGLAPYFTR